MTYALTWLPKVLSDAGLHVVEIDGWKSRGHGDMGTVRGVLCHHTAGGKTGNMPSLNIVTKGRPDLSGPLCNLGLGRDGTWYVVAAGSAYHAGGGAWQGITNGNKQMIGIEAENTGLANDKPWPAVQMDSYARGCAALLKKIGAEAIMCAGHKEYALPKGRKPDPSFNMVEFRKAVAAFMAGDSPSPVAAANPKFKVTGVAPDTLNLRDGPNGTTVGEIAEKTLVEKLAVNGKWMRVRTPTGVTAWVASRFLTAA